MTKNHECRFITSKLIPLRPGFIICIRTCRVCTAISRTIIRDDHESASLIRLDYVSERRKRRRRNRAAGENNNTNNNN